MNTKVTNDILIEKLLEIAAYEKLDTEFREFQGISDKFVYEPSPKFEKRIRKGFKKKTNERETGRVPSIIRTIAASIAVILSLSFVGIMANATVRHEVYSMIVEIKEKFVSIFVKPTDDEITEDVPVTAQGIYEAHYIPYGYSLIRENDFIYTYQFIYSTEDGNRLLIEETLLGSGIVFNIDDEKHDIEHTDINGFECIIFSISGDDTNIYTIWNNDTHLFHIVGTLDKDEIVKILLGLKMQK